MRQYGMSMDKYMERATERITGVMSKWSYEKDGESTWRLLNEDGKLAATMVISANYILFMKGELSATYMFPEYDSLRIANFTSINKTYMGGDKLVSSFHPHASNRLPSFPGSEKNIEAGWSGEVAMYDLQQRMKTLNDDDEWISEDGEMEGILENMSGFDYDKGTWEWEIEDLFKEFHKPLWEALENASDEFGATMTEVDLFPLLAFEKLNELIEKEK